jgi:hypothetical protein
MSDLSMTALLDKSKKWVLKNLVALCLSRTWLFNKKMSVIEPGSPYHRHLKNIDCLRVSCFLL